MRSHVRRARNDLGGLAMHRFVRLTLAIAIAAAAGSVTRSAHAAGPARPATGSVAVELTAQRVTRSQGKEVLVPADEAKPGDLIEYSALYRNDGAGEAKGLMATLPIPRGTQYVAGSATPRGAEASVDGHTFASLPLKRTVHTPDGRTIVQDVPVAEYRALRWPLGTLPSKQQRTVRTRVRVEAIPVAENSH
jgi:uncharacterized repeat protein (TIGR01451 family)